MIVSSTEFQQNVGFYLKEAQKGKSIQIRKTKPGEVFFNLSVLSKDTTAKRKITRNEMVTRLIKEINLPKSKESALEFQNRVRS